MTVPRVSTERQDIPDTPRERELRKQVNDLLAKVARQRDHYEAVLAARKPHPVQPPEDTSALQTAHVGIKRLKEKVDQLERQIERNGLERRALEARLAAGAERRKGAIICLNALLTCEDEDLSDAAYDVRMDRVVKCARRIVGAERKAIREASAQQGTHS